MVVTDVAVSENVPFLLHLRGNVFVYPLVYLYYLLRVEGDGIK